MKLDQWQGIDNNTLFTIAGYTNANSGETINIVMDSGTSGDYHEIAAHTWTTKAWGNLSSYRYWNATFIFNVQNEAQGQHYITITNNAGATATVPFYVYRELPAHYVPQNYLQYINNSPYLEPVKVTVTVTVPVPVPGPTQQIPPSEEQINTAAQKIVNKQNADVVKALLITGGVVAAFLLLMWARSAYRRVKKG